MSEGLKFVGRHTHAQTRTFKKPVIKVDLKYNKVLISQKAADVLGVRDGEGIIFAFGATDVYVRKHNEEDAYIIHRKDRFCFQFASRSLIRDFIAVLKPSTQRTNFVYNLNVVPDKRGLFMLEPVEITTNTNA